MSEACTVIITVTVTVWYVVTSLIEIFPGPGARWSEVQPSRVVGDAAFFRGG